MKVPSILTMSTSSDAEIAERGEAGAEIVDRHAAAPPRAAGATKAAASSRFLIIAVSVISTISRSASDGRAASAVVSRAIHSVSPTVSAETLIEMRRPVRMRTSSARSSTWRSIRRISPSRSAKAAKSLAATSSGRLIRTSASWKCGARVSMSTTGWKARLSRRSWSAATSSVESAAFARRCA